MLKHLLVEVFRLDWTAFGYITREISGLGMQLGAAESTGSQQVDDALAQSRTWMQDARNLQLLTIYEQRIRRAVDKAIVQLQSIQTKRQEAAQEDMRKAKLLYQLAQAEGRPYEPEPFFTAAPAVRESVFSTDEIVRELARERQYRDASDYAYEGMRPRKFSVTPPKPTATGHRPPAASLTSDR